VYSLQQHHYHSTRPFGRRNNNSCNLVYSDEFKDDEGNPLNVLLFAYGAPDENGYATESTTKVTLKATDNLFDFSYIIIIPLALLVEEIIIVVIKVSAVTLIKSIIYVKEFDCMIMMLLQTIHRLSSINGQMQYIRIISLTQQMIS